MAALVTPNVGSNGMQDATAGASTLAIAGRPVSKARAATSAPANARSHARSPFLRQAIPARLLGRLGAFKETEAVLILAHAT